MGAVYSACHEHADQSAVIDYLSYIWAYHVCIGNMAKANAMHRTISKHKSPLAVIDVHYVVNMCALMRQVRVAGCAHHLHMQARAIRHLLSMVKKIDDDEERRTLQAACHTALIHMCCE